MSLHDTPPDGEPPPSRQRKLFELGTLGATYLTWLNPRPVFRVISVGLSLFGLGALLFLTPLAPYFNEALGRAHDALSTYLSGARGGMLFIEPPQVYTRERLVNDRFAQANWLEKELEFTEREKTPEPTVAVSQAVRSSLSTSAGIGTPQPLEAAKAGKPDSSAAGDAPDGARGLELEQIEKVSKRLNYRNWLRSELMDTQLDDNHDLDGNTLYRFNFDTVVMPWADVRSYPGTAVFIVTAESSRPDDRPDDMTGDNVRPNDLQLIHDEVSHDIELMESWMRDFQIFLNRVIDFRVSSFTIPGKGENKTDPKEGSTFDLYLRQSLFESFANIVGEIISRACEERVASDGADQSKSGTPAGDGPICGRGYQGLWRKAEHWASSDAAVSWTSMSEIQKKKEQERQRLERKNIIAKRMKVILDDRQVLYGQDMEFNFRKILATAHEINIIHWPTATPHSLVPGCSTKFLSPESNKSSMEIAAELNRHCLHAYIDPGNKLAMVRLLLAMDAVNQYLSLKPDYGKINSNSPNSVSHEIKFSAEETDPLNPLENILAIFNTLIPNNEDIRSIRNKIAWLISDDFKAKNGFSIVEFLDRNCDTSAYLESPRNIYKAFEYGKCRMISLNAWNTNNIIAKFLKKRLDEADSTFGGALNSIARFVDIELSGCEVGRCRIDLQPKQRNDIDCDLEKRACILNRPASENLEPPLIEVCNSFNKQAPIDTTGQKTTAAREKLKRAFFQCIAASELRNWLERRGNGIAVYDVAPRNDGRVGSNQDTRRLAAAARGMSGGPELSGSVNSERDSAAIGVDATIVGFGSIEPKTRNTPQADPYARQATFGWIIRPVAHAGGRWMPSHHRLSTVLSLPGWWKRVNFHVEACWMSPNDARAIGGELLNKPHTACESQQYKMTRDFSAQLPRRTEEVTERFRFDFIKAPYLDEEWLAVQPNQNPLQLEAGKPGKLVIIGARLWRGTVVTVMGRPADKITVLPDMKGIVAEFDCVAKPPNMALPQANALSELMNRNSSQSTVHELTVWTSEGRTQSVPVQIFAFSGAPKDACVPGRSRVTNPAEGGAVASIK